jgi:hypothetical protein
LDAEHLEAQREDERVGDHRVAPSPSRRSFVSRRFDVELVTMRV